MANRFAGLADAYTNWGAAVANEKLQSDPFYQFTQIAAQAAQEWAFEKKKDKQIAKKKSEGYVNSMTDSFLKATDGYNQQTKDLAYSTLETYAGRIDEASLAGDTKAMNSIFGEAQGFVSQLRQGQEIMKNHATALTEGSYSDGSGLAKLNKFQNGEYTTYYDPLAGGQLHFRIKDENGGVVVDSSFDEFEAGSVNRADAFTGLWDQKIDQEVNNALESGQYAYDKNAFTQIVNQTIANKGAAYSLFHDNLLPNQAKTVSQEWNENNPNANQDWQSIWNTELPVNPEVIGGKVIANSGYNEDAIGVLVENKLYENAQSEFEKRLKAKQDKIRAAENRVNKKEKDNFQVGDYQYVPTDVITNVRNNIKNKKTVVFEGETWVPDGDGWIREGDGAEVPNNEVLIYTIDKQRGFIRNSSLFTSLIKPTL
tara:strand:- start:375 stop:1652 length:1278 start_codon:yes stop_codon:yes gene_type:complete